MNIDPDEQDGLYDSLPEISTNMPILGEDIPVSILSLNPPEEPSSSQKNSVQKCSCTENVQWAWEENPTSKFVRLANNNVDVMFHRNHSNGTALVRCAEPMTDKQYYWEVKMTYPVYGSDIMIGVGTSEVETNDIKSKYLSVLGNDDKTWGLSYTGLFHHNGDHQFYMTGFHQGSTIGIHLDLWRGTLSFSKNRKQLGVATSGLRGKTLYAMASSTAAHSGMRIVYSCSYPSSLQFMCCQKLREMVPSDKDVLEEITVPPGLKNHLKINLSWLLRKQVPDIDKHVCVFDSGVKNDLTPLSNLVEIGRPSDVNMFVNGQYVFLDSILLSNQNRFLPRSTFHIRTRYRRLEEGESSGNSSKRVRFLDLDDPDQL